MADWLMYYKSYWDNAVERDAATDEWYAGQEYWYKQAQSGDCLWVVVRDELESPDEWRLLEKLVIVSVDFVEEYHKPGWRPYHATCDKEQNQYFDIYEQADFAPILKQIEFASGRRIQANGALIGRSLMAVRLLRSPDDIEVLEDYANRLTAVTRDEIRSPWWVDEVR